MMMASSTRRSKVCYKLDSIIQKLPFYQCVLQLFAENGDKACDYVQDIGYSFSDGDLLLWKQYGGVKLFHPNNCPLKNYLESNDGDVSKIGSDVMLGSAVLLRSSDGLVLLSRRSKKLKTFPGIWVPPGGHVEIDETLEAAAIRELEEEVGIGLEEHEFDIKLLCLFESCYPPFIEWGPPRRHHIVTYYILQTTLTKDELNSRIKLQEAEVDACMWCPDSVCKALSEGQSENLPKVEFMSMEDGVLTTNLLRDPGILVKGVDGRNQSDTERISTGTIIALKSFVEQNYDLN